MKLTIDTTSGVMTWDEEGRQEAPLYSAAAFAQLSRLWVKVGWDLKYSYTFTWMGRPVVQLPEDMIRVQEVIYRVRPDVIIETGVAHGGSLIFYASLFRAMGRGRVIGIDCEIRPANRKAIETHELAAAITLIEGSSVAPRTLEQVRALVKPADRVLVILDSDHSKAHVANELVAYASLVSVESYIIATDGIMYDLHDVPHGKPHWSEDNPRAAAAEFVATHHDFVLEDPPLVFSEAQTPQRVTYWPGAYLRRVQAP